MNWGAVTVLLIESLSELECESISTFILIDSSSAIRVGEQRSTFPLRASTSIFLRKSVCFVILPESMARSLGFRSLAVVIIFFEMVLR